MKPALYILIAGLFLLTGVLVLATSGVTVHHNVHNAKHQTVTVPETVYTIEIPRKNGKEPFHFNIKSPEKKIQIDRKDD